MIEDMNPSEIRARMVIHGVPQARIAETCGVSRTMITKVIDGKSVSDRVQKAIAAAIKMDVSKIWPTKYADGEPRRPGRPRAT